MTLRVAHFIPYSGRAQGGPVQGLATYTAELVRRGCDVSILSVARSIDGPQMEFDPHAHVLTSSDARLGSYRWSPELHARAAKVEAHIIHSHCLFMDVNRLAAITARRLRVPHLLSPCGHLMVGALRRSAWKKLLAGFVFQDRALREAQCLQAKSEMEFEGIRESGVRTPIAVLPNPVIPPPADAPMDPQAFRARYSIPQDKRIVLYLGRIHPVKGTMRLVDAWAQIAEFHRTWQLVLAGPDEGGFQREVEDRLRRHGATSSVTFTGDVRGETKWNAYAAASLFVMPSDYENFGLSIAEALHAGVPVIATDRTPWKKLPAMKAGWWVGRTPEAIAGALHEAMTKPPEELAAMGANARMLAAAYTPEAIGADMVATYEWMLGHAARPECVIET